MAEFELSLSVRGASGLPRLDVESVIIVQVVVNGQVRHRSAKQNCDDAIQQCSLDDTPSYDSMHFPYSYTPQLQTTLPSVPKAATGDPQWRVGGDLVWMLSGRDLRQLKSAGPTLKFNVLRQRIDSPQAGLATDTIFLGFALIDVRTIEPAGGEAGVASDASGGVDAWLPLHLRDNKSRGAPARESRTAPIPTGRLHVIASLRRIADPPPNPPRRPRPALATMQNGQRARSSSRGRRDDSKHRSKLQTSATVTPSPPPMLPTDDVRAHKAVPNLSVADGVRDFTLSIALQALSLPASGAAELAQALPMAAGVLPQTTRRARTRPHPSVWLSYKVFDSLVQSDRFELIAANSVVDEGAGASLVPVAAFPPLRDVFTLRCNVRQLADFLAGFPHLRIYLCTDGVPLCVAELPLNALLQAFPPGTVSETALSLQPLQLQLPFDGAELSGGFAFRPIVGPAPLPPTCMPVLSAVATIAPSGSAAGTNERITAATEVPVTARSGSASTVTPVGSVVRALSPRGATVDTGRSHGTIEPQQRVDVSTHVGTNEEHARNNVATTAAPAVASAPTAEVGEMALSTITSDGFSERHAAAADAATTRSTHSAGTTNSDVAAQPWSSPLQPWPLSSSGLLFMAPVVLDVEEVAFSLESGILLQRIGVSSAGGGTPLIRGSVNVSVEYHGAFDPRTHVSAAAAANAGFALPVADAAGASTLSSSAVVQHHDCAATDTSLVRRVVPAPVGKRGRVRSGPTQRFVCRVPLRESVLIHLPEAYQLTSGVAAEVDRTHDAPPVVAVKPFGSLTVAVTFSPAKAPPVHDNDDGDEFGRDGDSHILLAGNVDAADVMAALATLPTKSSARPHTTAESAASMVLSIPLYYEDGTEGPRSAQNSWTSHSRASVGVLRLSVSHPDNDDEFVSDDREDEGTVGATRQVASASAAPAAASAQQVIAETGAPLRGAPGTRTPPLEEIFAAAGVKMPPLGSLSDRARDRMAAVAGVDAPPFRAAASTKTVDAMTAPLNSSVSEGSALSGMAVESKVVPQSAVTQRIIDAAVDKLVHRENAGLTQRHIEQAIAREQQAIAAAVEVEKEAAAVEIAAASELSGRIERVADAEQRLRALITLASARAAEAEALRSVAQREHAEAALARAALEPRVRAEAQEVSDRDVARCET